MENLRIEYRRLDEITPYENNPRINDNAVEAVASSIREFGFQSPIIVDSDGVIIAGHTRLKAAKLIGLETAPVTVAEGLTDEQAKALRLADNKTGELAEWDYELLGVELDYLQAMDFDLETIGFTPEEVESILGGNNSEDDGSFRDKLKNNPIESDLKGTFIVPPFSVLNTATAQWQNRKKAWYAMGLADDSVGRSDNLCISKNIQALKNDTGTSVFDPVLAEISYRWFAPDGESVIFDPFAGGAVRGIVAAKTGHRYIGIDLREEQVRENMRNAEAFDFSGVPPTWVCDDSLNMDRYLEDGTADLVFTCPPYFDLEQYSDDPHDISNMTYDDFTDTFHRIMRGALRKLKPDRFCVVVISDVRDQKGAYRGMVQALTSMMMREGAVLYNDMILLNPVGSAAVRARNSMRNRKITRIHQNVLCYYRGDTNRIQDSFPVLGEITEDALAQYAKEIAD